MPEMTYGHSPYKKMFDNADVYGIGYDEARAAKRKVRLGIIGFGGVALSKHIRQSPVCAPSGSLSSLRRYARAAGAAVCAPRRYTVRDGTAMRRRCLTARSLTVLSYVRPTLCITSTR